ncbi:MAG: phosphonate ABC transporter, permease protein PhnE [Defluviitaleaceae bacterium]|nr:phosphonate ABC transporter, permease protein PhnE [Defluviitaleaceae bacterium]MCL2203811.1 phosphonate ABC transporter, permease protein PhnE [Defluviitaleaceae bacterium]MCL2239280.1 phosphonate ABC transporter, permease protein PhnE [Defluviitaleaceae bacterium]
MHDRQVRVKFWANVALVAAVVVLCFFYLGLDPVRILTAAPHFAGYIAVNFFPPSLTHAPVYISAVLHTVAFAVVSTCISAVLSFIFALLMSEAIMPWRAVRWVTRFVMTFVRNIPVIIWASLMVLVFGIGSMVGLIALILATTGFLSRSYAESIGEIAAKKLEPLRASGVRTLGIIRHGLLPEFAPAWFNWTLFAFELNIRASAVLGMVGAGGMGVMIQTQLNLRRFNEVATMVLLLIFIVLCTELAAGWIRKKQMGVKVPRVKGWVLALAVAAVFFICLNYLNLDMARFLNRLSNAPRILRLLADVNVAMLLPGVRQFFVSFAMGIVGLVFGGLLAFVLAFCAADNITPWRPLAFLIKAFVSIVRAVPSLIIILMIVAAIGLGHNAGVVGLTLSSMGYLTKAFIATIEEQHRGLITAMRATGANWGQIVLHGLLPAVVTGFLAWVAIRLETSVAESITLGVVGAGGIGTLLARAIRQFDYPTVTLLILIIFIGMACLEGAVSAIRRRIF